MMFSLCFDTVYTGVGEGGGGGGAIAPPPLFGHVCTLNEEKNNRAVCQPQHEVSIIYETNVEQLNQNFCLRCCLMQGTKNFFFFLGGGGGGGQRGLENS